MVGINHNSAPLEVREEFSLSQKDLRDALHYLLKQEGIQECFLFSTCNRTELYAWCESKNTLLHYLSSYFNEIKSVNNRFISGEMFYFLEEEHAVKHLLRVACGLDSTVLGETQVLGQIKDAFLVCQEEKAGGTYINGLVQKAISMGKRAHTETGIGKHAVSFGYASAELARRNFSSLEDKCLVVIGTGEMAKLTLQNIFDLGIKEVVVASHYRSRAEALASRFEGKTVNLKEVDSGLEYADVVICATSAPHYVITARRLLSLLGGQRKEPLLIVDLGVPRNVEPSVDEIQEVKLFNLDDVNRIIQENLKTRQSEARRVEIMVQEEVLEYLKWYQRQKVNPLIADLRQKAEDIRQEKMEEFEKQLASLSPRQRKAVEKLSRSLVNSFIKDPIMSLKDLSLEKDYEMAEKYARIILGLQEEEKPGESRTGARKK